MKPRIALTAVAAATLMMGVAACGSSSGGSAVGGGSSSKTASSSSSTTAAAMSGLVGPGCGDYAKAVPTGAGSVDGMAQDPVATAASNNPLLKTLTAAVSAKL